MLVSGSVCTCARCDCEGLRGSEFLSPLSLGRIQPQSPRTYSMKSLTQSLLPRRWAGRGGAEQSSAGTKGAARREERRGREGRGLGRGRVVGDVTGADRLGWPRNASAHGTQSDPARPDPPPSSEADCLPHPPLAGSQTSSTLQTPVPSPPRQKKRWAFSVPAPPNLPHPLHQDPRLRDAPAPGTPESWLGALTSEELRAPPRSVRQPLPPPLAPAPPPPLGTGVACPPAADSGPGNPPPRLRLRAAHCADRPSLSSASPVIGPSSTSALVIAAHSPPLSPGHTRTHSGQ